MSKLLYIIANPKPAENSRTTQIANAFIEAYKSSHPGDEITTLDLYAEGISFLTEQNVMLHATASAEDASSPNLRYALQFVEADKYVFAEPFWNLSIPAILKAYIDYICMTNITFKYTAEGAVGLCHNKRAVNITTRGGQYSEGPGVAWEMGDRYLRTILGFLGITDFATIAADMVDVQGLDTDSIVANAVEQAKALAQNF